MISRTYEEWKSCIVNDCKIKLTKEYAEKRIKIYENQDHPETRKFRELYGEQYLNIVIHWFKRSQSLSSDMSY